MTKLLFQDYGSAILLFIQGESRDEAYWKWVSLANWGATTFNDPDWVSDNVCTCWSTVAQLKNYLFNLRTTELMMKESTAPWKGKKGGFGDFARELAADDFAAIPVEHFRSVNDNVLPYDLGVIAAEKPDESFADKLLTYSFTDREPRHA